MAQPVKSKQIPCVYFNSHEKCTHSDETCKYSHKPMCTHIGCLQRGKALTHLKENCAFIKNNVESSPAAAEASQESSQEETKDQILDKIYKKIAAKLSGKLTGMFSEGCDMSELKNILEDDKVTNDNIKLACEVLLNA